MAYAAEASAHTSAVFKLRLQMLAATMSSLLLAWAAQRSLETIYGTATPSQAQHLLSSFMAEHPGDCALSAMLPWPELAVPMQGLRAVWVHTL